jgi:mRNA-degrading endonuclease YafQ of YafQ-DinJ toxin-antitoxin module
VSRNLLRTPAFLRAARRYLKKHRDQEEELNLTLALLAQDAFDARLKTHKLKGAFEGLWACSAGYDLRVLFEFVLVEGDEAILLHSVGTHDDVY